MKKQLLAAFGVAVAVPTASPAAFMFTPGDLVISFFVKVYGSS